MEPKWHEKQIATELEENPVTRVVNFYHEPCDVKITRTPKGEIPEPPNPGCFGNPFNLKQFSREESVELHQDYFLNRIDTDAVFRQAVLGLKGKRLGCVCKQKNKEVACHGDIIKEWLDAHDR